MGSACADGSRLPLQALGMNRVVVAESNSHNPLGCPDHPELGPPVFPALQRFKRGCGRRPTSLVCLENTAAYLSFHLLHSWESLTVRAASP